MILVNSQNHGSTLSHSFSLTYCFDSLLPPLFLCFQFAVSLLSPVFVLLKGSFRSLQVTLFSTIFHFSHPSSVNPSVNLGFVTGEHSWLGVLLLVTALSSRAHSRMLMKRLCMN